jgi:hypothetical protein
VVSLKGLPQWIDQTLRPAGRTARSAANKVTPQAAPKPLALSLLQIRNWDEATRNLDDDAQETARAAAYCLGAALLPQS